jgi:prepilin-type processing-associated H-X9-DG protein
LVPDYVRDAGVFICPSTRNQPDRWIALQGGQRQPNFRSPNNLSYSYASPFSGNAQYRLNSDILPSEFALMADKNPGAAAASVAHDAPPLELARANSLNHGQAGQNVLFADGSVDFMRTPYCGVGRSATSPDGDNIYTVLTAEPLTEKMASPIYWGRGYVGRQYGAAYEYDSYLVPTEEDGW